MTSHNSLVTVTPVNNARSYEIAALNDNRQWACIVNTSGMALYIQLGQDVSTDVYCYKMAPNEPWIVPSGWLGRITGIRTVGGFSPVVVVELIGG